MNKNWLIQNSSSSLIMFFNGWGMDENAVSHLNIEDCDLIEFNDYKYLDFKEAEYQNYSCIYVVAWSLGVWAASNVLRDTTLSVQKSIAINGTCNPVDEFEGINPEVFKGTIRGWNEKNRERFLVRVAGGRKAFASLSPRFGNRTITDQKEELSAIYDHIRHKSEYDFHFDYAMTGERDAIFPYQNQMNFWENKSHCETYDMPHYPFSYFSRWEEVFNR